MSNATAPTATPASPPETAHRVPAARDTVQAALARLREALGAEYVTDSKPILATYWRDFTHTVGRKPQLVALPGSTQDVQAIVRIAGELGLPVVPLSTGFNHGGLCVPRRGGIVVDLKRMTELCRIDEEAMTITVSPYVTHAAVFEEVVNREAAPGLKMRPANAITMGGVSFMANHISGGVSHMVYKGGPHHENIVSMTWVLPDGSILKTGPGSYLDGAVPAVHGPGPDVGGMFLAAEGQFGICTEITIGLFTEGVVEKMFMLVLKAEDFGRVYELQDVVDTIYSLSRENFVQDFYKTGNRHAAMYAAPVNEVIEDLLEGNAIHILVVTLTGLDKEELRIKEAHLRELAEKSPMEVIPDFVLDQLFKAMRLTRAEAQRVLFKKVYSAGRSQRWNGSFQWVAFPCRMDWIPRIERRWRKLMERTMWTASPDTSFDKLPFGISLQGPFPMGRFTALEFDFYMDQGNPEQVKRCEIAFEKVIHMCLDEGLLVGRAVARSHDFQFPRLGTYAELARQIKKTMDPAGIMHPDAIPLLDDSL